MIDLTVHWEGRAHNLSRAKEHSVLLPTFAQLRDPRRIGDAIRAQLSKTPLSAAEPINLFRLHWHNEAKANGGQFQSVPNYVEIPPALSGVPCRILAMAGKWFPTGCHKVGAAYGCLVPRLVTGQFDAAFHRAVWPSTGNFCRGGVFLSRLLGAEAVAIVPKTMSQERFAWLRSVGCRMIVTPGEASGARELLEETQKLRADPSMMIMNQFAEMGNPLWHYNVTGAALAELFEAVKRPGQRLAGAAFCSGSGGTLAAGEWLKERYPQAKLAAGEALQAAVMLQQGFGKHRIEGVGDRLIPWVQNVRQTDLVIAVDDADALALLRLFNTETGIAFLREGLGLCPEQIASLGWMGISGIANVLCCIKLAKWLELSEDDVLVTVLTDSKDLYRSRIEAMEERFGPYDASQAERDYALHLLGQKTDQMTELTYPERKRIHNQKYRSWVEEQGKSEAELRAQWERPAYWDEIHRQTEALDARITEFNEEAGA